MARHHPRVLRAAGVAAVGGLLLSAAGCSNLPGDLYADDLDVTRAQTIWSDPWVAPDTLSVPEAAWGSNDQVNRTAGTRRTIYVGTGPKAAARAEITAAGRHGWELVGASCSDQEVSATLTRGGTDLDQAAVAQVTVPAGSPSQEGYLRAVVTASVPHHLDQDWPDLGRAILIADTCLAGGDEDGTAAPAVAGAPRGDVDDDVDVPEWADDDATEADLGRWDTLSADPWFASVAPDAGFDPDVEGGDTRRVAPGYAGSLTPGSRNASRAVAAVVAEMSGWTLTFASCAPSTGIVATLRLDDDQGPVTARLSTDPLDAGTVSWSVRLPVVAGPDQSWVDDVDALDGSRCLSGRATRSALIEGTPVGLIGRLQAMQ